jgi:hypothetical protein
MKAIQLEFIGCAQGAPVWVELDQNIDGHFPALAAAPTPRSLGPNRTRQNNTKSQPVGNQVG